MFKGFQSTNQFRSFPSLNFQMNTVVYGFNGCTFWMDAAYGTNTVTDGANVSSWKNKINNSIFNQATAANQPVYIASEPSLNNYPAVSFQTSKFMSSSNDFGYGVGLGTIAFVHKSDLQSVVTDTTLFKIDATSSAGNRIIAGGAGTRGIGVTGATSNLYSTVRTLTPHITVINQTSIIIDGSVSTTGTFDVVSGLFRIGTGQDAVGDASAYSRIAEIIVWRVNYTDSQCVQICNTINGKYAIY